MTLTYLDHAASTPVRSEVVEAMLPHFTESYANPSGSHRFARSARRAVDEARDLVAQTVGCRPNEVVFTSGGTESDNTAVFGAVARTGGVAVCPATEHHAVLHVVEQLDGEVVGVDAAGRVDLDALRDRLDAVAASGRTVAVVSVMAVNNEVGSINELASVADIVRRHAPDALLHTDAVQAAAWLDLRDVTAVVDLMSLSGHKFGAPKGVGALIERGGPRVAPLMIGGGQERERRSGTQNTAGIVGFATALAATDAERATELPRLAALRDRLVDGLAAGIPGLVETVERVAKVAGSAHVCVPGVESEALLYLLDEADVCASAASACAAGAMEPSHVLAAMGVPREVALGALRLSLGRTTTDADVERATEVIVAATTRLRERGGALL